MADAVCGPSNPLQQFKQHTDVDPTLHQDRLASRQGPGQGFRSHNANTRLVDNEFEAFQAGVEPQLLDHVQHFQGPAGFGPSSQAPAWATDFQRLQISPQPMQQHPQHFQPGPSTGGWASGFQNYLAQTAPKAQSSSPSPLAFQQRARGYGGLGFQSSFPQQSYQQPMQSKGKEPQVVDQFDDAAFAEAFDQAHEDLMVVEKDSSQHANVQEGGIEELGENIEQAAEQAASQMLNESNLDLEALEEYNPSRIHGGDIEHDPLHGLHEDRSQERPMEENDALAATAQELLEKVEHNQSDKFKNSQFLGLMRKLRDREVKVEGDKMVETANASSMSIADGALNASSNVQYAPGVYHSRVDPVPLPAHVVDSHPDDHQMRIPMNEQDHDPGRINPKDGQEVVDLLNQHGPVTDDMASSNTSISNMLYGPGGPLSMS